MEVSENPPSVFTRLKTFFSGIKTSEQDKPIAFKEHKPTLENSLLKKEWYKSEYPNKK